MTQIIYISGDAGRYGSSVSSYTPTIGSRSASFSGEDLLDLAKQSVEQINEWLEEERVAAYYAGLEEDEDSDFYDQDDDEPEPDWMQEDEHTITEEIPF